MKLWLVQRGEFKTTDLTMVTGIDSLILYDDMGAAEYEFGALGESLRRIKMALSEYGAADTNIKAQDGRALILFNRDGTWAETCRAVRELAEGKVWLKMGARMDVALRVPDKRFPERTNFWWDIQNDWMAWLGVANTPLVKQSLAGNTPKRG